MSEKAKLLKSILLETVVYAIMVSAYFLLALRLLGGWLLHLFELPGKLPYAIVSLSLVVGQGVALELVTSALLRFIRRKTE